MINVANWVNSYRPTVFDSRGVEIPIEKDVRARAVGYRPKDETAKTSEKIDIVC